MTDQNRTSSLPSFWTARRSLGLLACAPLLALMLTGCKATPADDAALEHGVQTSLGGDAALNGLGLQGQVQGGVATLTGTAQNDAQRSLAARDAAGVQGIRQVVNNISLAAAPVTIPPASAEVVTPPPAPIPVPIRNTSGQLTRQQERERERQARLDQQQQDRQQEKERQQQERQQREAQNRQQAPVERGQGQYGQNGQSQAPPPPPQPVFRDLTVPAGYVVPVRITQTIDSADAQQGQPFSGVVANDVMADGVVALAAGTRVSGQVDQVQDAGHFRGNSLLTVSLSNVTTRGERLAISTEPYTLEGKGRGKNTAEKAGGGAAVGAILGGIFGGGKGAAIGAATGGGLGAGTNAITRGEQVQIPSESIVRFRLIHPVQLHVRVDGRDNGPGSQDPALQRHDHSY